MYSNTINRITSKLILIYKSTRIAMEELTFKFTYVNDFTFI